MAKRRRRKITIKNSSLFAFFALISLFLLDENSAYQHQNPFRYNHQQKHHYIVNQPAQLFAASSGDSSSLGREETTPQLRSSQLSFMGQQQTFQEPVTLNLQQERVLLPSNYQQNNQYHYSNNNQQPQQQPNYQREISNLTTDHHTANLCSSLPREVARQLKLCKLISHSPSADDAVSLGTSKGLAECQSQFKNDRWNCTHAAGDHQLLTSELTQSIGNPESGFIHAIAAAGIVHSIATACSVGNLSDCACDRSRVGTIDWKNRGEQPIHWKWGGCSNNIRHGMMFAKHLVELLDTVHQHSLLQQLHHHHHQQQQQLQHHHHHHHQQHHHQYRQEQQEHHLSRRSTIMVRDHLLNQRPPEAMSQLQTVDHLLLASSGASTVPQRDFCQQNQNISQAKHHELIKSLLSKNSLEKHQEFRLAMNMHNNKIGRMAVAKNMKLQCRCHGLSGSCSLQTCWLTLPSFEVIGRYLKQKYESSVHLPRAVNLNKLIPMMDRQEISAILSSQESGAEDYSSESEPHLSSLTSASTTEFISHEQQPEYAALVRATKSNNDGDSHHEQIDSVATAAIPAQTSNTVTLAPTTSLDLSPNLNLNLNHTMTGDERPSPYDHQLHTQTTLATPTPLTSQPVEIPTNLEPLSQQQYQTLLRDMKLCNTIQGNHLQTRDLNHHSHLARKQQQKQHHHHQQQQQLLNGQQTKQANQQLSHLLHNSDKDELIHLHKSPKYCDADLRHGFVGIQSRVCSDKENAPDNCDRLCCGRGHKLLILQNASSCKCRFQFCCTVTCSICRQESRVLVCN